MSYTLTLLDTTGIQDYIFSSNRLQENIGASELVYRATSLWVFDALEKLKLSHNINRSSNGIDWDFTKAAIESDTNLQAEVIQAAGGNTLILFREKEKSREFVRTLTLRLLQEAPGLDVLAQHLDGFDFANDKLMDARQTLEESMRTHKLSRPASSRTFGLSVTAECDSTGLPAVRTPVGKQTIGDDEFDLLVPGQDKKESERNRLISRETTFKLAAREWANTRLKNLAGEIANWYEFPFDIDKLGRIAGEESYVAVIHADGNKMGDHVKAIAKDASGNRDYIRAMRSFSKKLESASQKALTDIVEQIVISIKDGMVAGKIPLVVDEFHTYIPIRPLVFGGDDVTLLCNGQIGIELATLYLKFFEELTLKASQEPDVHPLAKKELKTLHASAGVSIVKMHYPFARAYKLSEELTESAKSLTRGTDCSALDWHFAQSGLSGSLDDIRKREFKVKAGQLNLRPLTLETWSAFESVMDEFNGNYWGPKHNKVIGLREPLRLGPQDVEKYRRDFGLNELPKFNGLNVQRDGWLNKVCYYFDAVELLDHHVSLKAKEAVK
jgi:hypothetical protein